MAGVESLSSVDSSTRKKPVPALSKSEKARLQAENQKRLSDIVGRISEKADYYLQSVMPKKISDMTKMLQNMGDFQPSLAQVGEAVKLPPSPFSSDSSSSSLPSMSESAASTDSKSSDSDSPRSSKKRKLNHPAGSENGESSTSYDFSPEILPYVSKSPRTPEQLERLKTHVPSNAKLLELLDPLKVEALAFAEMAGVLKLWIQLHIPRIEDGNNFGVGVQEEIVEEVAATEDAAFNIIEHITKYFVSRGKMVSKVVKWPQFEDYRYAVKEMDEKQYIQLRLDCLELKNHYLTLFDLIKKNLEKLKKPRSSAAFQAMF